MVMYNPSPPDSLKYFRNGAGAAAKQYGGERATYDNKFIIVKGDLATVLHGHGATGAMIPRLIAASGPQKKHACER